MTYPYENVLRGALLQAQTRPVEFKVAEARSMDASPVDDEEIRAFVTARADAANGFIETEAFRAMSKNECYIEQDHEIHADPK